MMRQKGIKLSVPEPCHEKWSEMSQSEKGRFCMSCQKEVVDFTTYSDEQILNYFSSASGKQCGRFHPMQLNKTIVPVRKVERPSVLKLIFSSLLVLLGFKESGAQEAPKAVSVSYVSSIDENTLNTQKHAPQNQDIIRGTIIDEESGEPLIGASLVFDNDKTRGTSTDIEGKFAIQIPPNLETDTITLVLSSIGFESQTLSFVRNQIPDSVIVNMKRANCVTMGIIVVEEPMMERLEKQRVKTILEINGHW